MFLIDVVGGGAVNSDKHADKTEIRDVDVPRHKLVTSVMFLLASKPEFYFRK